MIPLLFAAALSTAASSPVLKDLPRANDAAPSAVLKDLPGALAQNPLDAPKRVWVLKVSPMGPLGLFGKPMVDKDGNPVTCKRSATQTLGPNGAPITKLGDLPPALEEHAVLRMVNGCPVREIVYAGQTYYLDAPTGGLERVDPTAYRIKQR